MSLLSRASRSYLHGASPVAVAVSLTLFGVPATRAAISLEESREWHATSVSFGDAVFADFDDDGFTDFVRSGDGGSVLVYRRLGLDEFENPVAYNCTVAGKAEVALDPPGDVFWVGGIAVTDFDEDGDLDLVVALQGLHDGFYASVSLIVRLNDGLGTFTQGTSRQLGGGRVVSICTGDLTGDGFPDVLAILGGAECPCYDSQQQVWWCTNQNGSGLSSPNLVAPNYQGVVSVALGDLDSNGFLDVAVTGLQGVGWVPNLGGVFGIPAQISAYDGGYQVQVWDGNADGILDVAVVGRYSYDRPDYWGLRVFEARSPGLFGVPLTDPGVLGGFPLSISDINGDSLGDLVIPGSSGVTAVVLAGGGGIQERRTSYGIGGRQVLDWDSDGRDDLITPSNQGVGVVPLRGDGTFRSPRAHYVVPGCLYMCTADFDRDGRLDVVATKDGSLGRLSGRGFGAFRYDSGYMYEGLAGSLCPTDLDSDGYVDLVCGRWMPEAPACGLTVFWNDHGTLFGDLGTAYLVGYAPRNLKSADFNGDGQPDVAATGYGSFILLHNTAGGRTFQPTQYVNVGAVPLAIAAQDLDSDGRPDLVAATGSDVRVLINRGASFSSPTTYVVGADQLCVADLDGDSQPDLVVGKIATKSVTLLHNSGGGAFQAWSDYSVSVPPSQIAAGDLNGDGRSDLVLAGLEVLENDGFGHFIEAGVYPIPGGGDGVVAIADVTSDGFQDVLVGCDEVVVYRNRTNVPVNTPGPVEVAEASRHLVISPNPFREHTQFLFTVRPLSHVSVVVLDVRGKLVKKLQGGILASGKQSYEWDGRTERGTYAPSGVYYCQISVNHESSSQKMTLLR